MKAVASKIVKPEPKALVPGLFVPAPESLPLSTFNMSPYNPRIISPAMMRALKASLEKHGMVLNLVVQRFSEKNGPMVLVGGHQRVRAMRELCAERKWPEPKRVTAVVLDVDDATAKQLNVSLNRVEGEFDPFKLGVLMADIYPNMSSSDVLAMGYERESIDVLIRETLAPEERAKLLEDEAGDIGDLRGFANSVTMTVEFATVAARDEAKEFVREMAKAAGAMAGDMLLSMCKAARAAKKG